MVAATAILFPLYIYPFPASLWDPLISAISSYPSLNFQVVINIDSGPGATQYPNSDYTPAIAELNSYSNVETLCYVHSSYTTLPLSAVENNITLCTGWADYTEADIHMDGIFFDESPQDYTSATGPYMSSAASFARNAGADTLMFNIGTDCIRRARDAMVRAGRLYPRL